MAAIDQVVDESQLQHQRYLDLFGPSPAGGEGFRQLSDSARQLAEQVNDIRDEVQALRFSTEVVGQYEHATASDDRPVTTTAHITQIAAHSTDSSAEVIRQGLSTILANSNSEINQVSAVPDRDSPEGQTAILNILAEHQARSVQTVTSSAAAQQANGAQAAAAAGGEFGGVAALGGAATTAMEAMLPAVESALLAAPKAATALLPALAGLASAPAGALTSAHQPESPHAGAPQHSDPPAPTSQPGSGAAPSSPQSGSGVLPSSPHPPQAPVGPGAPTPPPSAPPHKNDDSDTTTQVQLAGFGSGQHAPESPPLPDPPHGDDPAIGATPKRA